MERRSFIKNSVVLGSSLLVAPHLSFGAQAQNPFGIDDGMRVYSIENNFNIRINDQVARLWIPLPFDAPYHKLLKISYEGDFDDAYISQDNIDGTRLLYVEWNKNSKSRELFVKFDVGMHQRSVNLTKPNPNLAKEDVAKYLQGTPHTPVSPFLTSFVQPIIKGKKSELEKAYAIYDWTVTNMFRDESVKGCGLGDATAIIEKKAFGGKCTDISSVCVALLRNANIPAREVFGIRAGASKISPACGKADEKGVAQISGAQHCRVEFYIAGFGWIPADPADVTKVRLQEKLTEQDQKFQDVKKYFFGNWEMNWVAFNHARDFVLSPKPAQFPLNMLGYPYGEIGEDVLDYYDPKSFIYSYKSTLITK